MEQEKKRAFLMMLGGAGLCGVACLAAPPAVVTACGVAVQHPMFAAGAALSGHFAVDLFARISDWWGGRPDDKNPAANHDLRSLVVQSIEKVLESVVKDRPGGRQGEERLKRYIGNVHNRMNEIDDDPRLEGIREQSIVPTFFKTRVKDFATVAALTPELWKIFLEPNIGPSVRAKHLEENELKAFEAAARALHENLPRYLVGVYRNAFKKEPAVYVAVMTEIQKEIWNDVSQVKATTQSIRDWQTSFGKVCVDYARKNRIHLQSLLSSQTALAKDVRAFFDDLQSRTGRMLEFLKDIAQVSRTGLEVGLENQKSLDRIEDRVNTLAGRLGATSISADEFNENIRLYLGWLKSRHEIIELRGIKHGNAQVIRLDLAKAYVPLRAVARPDDEGAAIQNASRGARHLRLVRHEHDAPKGDADVPMDKVLREGKRLAITGGAGSGKTTVLRSMVQRLTTALLDKTDLPEVQRLGLERNSALPLPIFVSLASFARYRRPAAGHRLRDLESFLAHDLRDNDATLTPAAAFFEQLLNGRDVILLLDGLDEVADDHEREDMRQWLAKFAAERPALRVVVTCRTVTYRNDTALTDFREVAVQPLDALHEPDMERYIAPMIRGAYAHIEVEQREKQIMQLLDSIVKLERERRERPGHDGKPLVDSPLMVRMMLIVQWSNHELPDERAALFDKAVEALFQVEYGIVVVDKMEIAKNWKRYRDMAQLLAFHLHQKGEAQGREIERPELKTLWSGESAFKEHIDDFLTQVHHRGGVVEERGGKFLFMHHAFQEFLVARYLREVMYGEGRQTVLDFLAPLLEEPWWREPMLLTAGYRTSEAPDEARKLIGALAVRGDTADEQFSAAELAGTAVLEWHDSGDEIRSDCARRIAELLSDSRLLEDSRPVIRARAGDVLSRLGDPRFGAERLYLPLEEDYGFVLVPEDQQFKIGMRRADVARVAKITGWKADDLSDEINDSLTPAPAFYMARYPVTVAQFRAFVEATKFRLGNEGAVRDADSRPVRYVSWHEAMAYCQWLQQQFAGHAALKMSPLGLRISEGWQITLPSELEWEKAARGGTGTIHPWGDEPDANRANFDDSGIGDTSAVGCFAANAYGLDDMIGNVFEWTRSFYKPYPYDAGDGREKLSGDDIRVVRGGSWSAHRDLARCAFRYWGDPGDRDDFLGFRLVLRFPLFKTSER